MVDKESKYLIIGGAPKAGTTSLFKWLADHPQVCASSLKETRFFLDVDYPLPCAKRFNGINLDDYNGLFKHCRLNHNNLMRVEATPDYLYSKTAVHIAELLPNAKIVFILRDPIERMVSWYKYARQRGMILKNISFDDYIIAQVGQPITPDTPVHLRALEQCRYEKFLPAFREAFGERCMIINFEEIKTDPKAVMLKLCAFSGLDATIYNTYSFRAENVSHEVRIGWLAYWYNAVRRKLLYACHNSPFMMKLFRTPNLLIKKILLMNTTKVEQVNVSDEIANIILREIRADIVAESSVYIK